MTLHSPTSSTRPASANRLAAAGNLVAPVRRAGSSPPATANRAYANRAPAHAVLALAMLGLGACRGPTLTVPTDGVRIVDGRFSPAETLPFRYYGTTVVDVLPRRPADPEAVLEVFERLPVREAIPIEEPVTPWLFPFDLPLELAVVLFSGIDDEVRRVETAVPAVPVVVGAVPGEVEQLRARAAAARLSR